MQLGLKSHPGIVTKVTVFQTISGGLLEIAYLVQVAPHKAGRKTALLEKAAAFRQCPHVANRAIAELARRRLRQDLAPFDRRFIDPVRDKLAVHAALRQLGTDAQRPVTLAAALIHVVFGKSFVTEQSAVLKAVEYGIDQWCIVESRVQLAAQLPAGVLPAGQQPDRGQLDGRRVVRLRSRLWVQSSPAAVTVSEAAAASATSGISAARIWASTWRAISGFSFRKLRTFSRPWPMRSPL